MWFRSTVVWGIFFLGARTLCCTTCLGMLTLPGAKLSACFRMMGCIVEALVFGDIFISKPARLARESGRSRVLGRVLISTRGLWIQRHAPHCGTRRSHETNIFSRGDTSNAARELPRPEATG